MSKGYRYIYIYIYIVLKKIIVYVYFDVLSLVLLFVASVVAM